MLRIGFVLLLASAGCLMAANAGAPASASRPLTKLIDPLAKCMDGTSSGFYYHPSPQPAQTKWVLTLQGGGECVSSKCEAKSKSALGSSNYFPRHYSFWMEGATHLADTSCKGNPRLCDYHQVFLPYCSQDLWSGRANTTSPASSSAPGYFFSGHHIFSAVIDALATQHGLHNATEVILSGESAGGFGVYNNVDWLAARLPRARVVGAPIAGYEFYAWPYEGLGHTSSDLADFTHAAMAGGSYNRLWDSIVPPACLEAHPTEPGACLLPAFSYVHIQTPLFIIEAQSDSVVLLYHDWVPPPPKSGGYTSQVRSYMAAFAANQTKQLASVMAPQSKDGLFNPACFVHTGFDNSITIENANGTRVGYLEALRAWLDGDAVKLADRCPEGTVLCNPTCPTLDGWKKHI